MNALAKPSLSIFYKIKLIILAFSENSPITGPIANGLIENLKESIQLRGEKILPKIQDLNSEGVALVGISDIHMKKVLPKICSSCCDSDSDVHRVMSIQEERPQ